MGFVSTISEDFLNEIGSIINSMGLLSQALHDVRAKAGGRVKSCIAVRETAQNSMWFGHI